MEKIFPISLELNFFPNTMVCYGLINVFLRGDFLELLAILQT